MQYEIIPAPVSSRQDQNGPKPNSLAVSFRRIAEQSAKLEGQRKRGPIKKVVKGKVGRNIKVVDRTYRRNEMQEVRTIQNNYNNAMSRSQYMFERIHANNESAS